MLVDRLESYLEKMRTLPVAPALDAEKIRNLASTFDFNHPLGFEEALDHVLHGLNIWQVHTPHPGYYGLFNPRSLFPGIAGDMIAAVYNPQLAAWSHSPFANEVENHLIRSFGERFGYHTADIDGNFTSGGAESNLTALLCALNHRFPDYAQNGLGNITSKPVFYVSAEAHHSFVKAARAAGLGTNNLRMIRVDRDLKMDVSRLEEAIRDDIRNGFTPFMVASTAGTTGAGVIDPLPEIEGICRGYQLWHHVDAAYGGAALLSDELAPFFTGLSDADSITFDAHKWLSVPMAGSLFITRRRRILEQTFRITADYMPKEAERMNIEDPYAHSLQWSRRFTGLKLYMSLLIFGWEGYAEILRKQTEMGNLLRRKLTGSGFTIYNQTPLPVILFGKEGYEHDEGVKSLCDKVLKSGVAWISVYNMQGLPTLRACITNYMTEEEDLDMLLNELT